MQGDTFENRQGESSREIVEALVALSCPRQKKSPLGGKGEGEGVSEGDRAVFSLGLATSRTNCLLVGEREFGANHG